MPIRPSLTFFRYFSIRYVGGAQLQRLDRADVHDVAHRARGVAVAGDRLGDGGVHDVVLAEAAPLLGQHQAEEPVRRRAPRGSCAGRSSVRSFSAASGRIVSSQISLSRSSSAHLLVGEEPVGLEHRIEPGHGRLGATVAIPDSSLSDGSVPAGGRFGLCTWYAIAQAIAVYVSHATSPARGSRRDSSDAGPWDRRLAGRYDCAPCPFRTHPGRVRRARPVSCLAPSRAGTCTRSSTRCQLDARPRPGAARDRRPGQRGDRLPRLLHLLRRAGRRLAGAAGGVRSVRRAGRAGSASSPARVWPAGWLSHNQPVFIPENALDDPRAKVVPEAEEEKYQSLCAAPLQAKAGDVIGVIALHAEAPTRVHPGGLRLPRPRRQPGGRRDRERAAVRGHPAPAVDGRGPVRPGPGAVGGVHPRGACCRPSPAAPSACSAASCCEVLRRRSRRPHA